MMPDLNGMEFAVREESLSLSLSLSLGGIYSSASSSSSRSSPFVLAKSLPRQIVHRAHSDNKQEVTTKPERRRLTRLKEKAETNMQCAQQVQQLSLDGSNTLKDDPLP